MERVTKCGYNVDEAEELARITALFTTVGDNMSADDASSYLISTLQGYQMAADQAEDIVDRYNQVANNFAIDTRGIGEALQRSAASFNAANTDLSKSIALITATNEVVQNPEAVGTLWKTLSARIRGAKTELEDLGEEEDEFTKTTSKLRDLVMSLTGFDIMEDEDTFKDIYEIILGIGEAWDDLEDVERASLGEALAGKRNANALYAVLGNLDTLKEAYYEAEHSAGSAAKEQENYAKSVQYSIDRLQASVEELSYDFLNSQLLKGAVEFANGFIQGLDSIVEHTNAVADAFVILGVVLAVKARKPLMNFAKEAVKALAEIGEEALLTGAATEGLSAEMAGLQVVMTRFRAVAPIIALITTAVVLGVNAWDDYQTTVEEFNDKIKDTTDKISKLQTEIKKLQDIDFRTKDEQDRLELLETELKFQERLLEIEQQRADVQKYGYTTYAQSWDKDNANNVLKDDEYSRGQTGLAIGDSRFLGMGFDAGTVSKAASDIKDYDKQLRSLNKTSEEYSEILEKRNKTEEDTIDNLENLYSQVTDYQEKLEDAQRAQRGFVKGSDSYNNAQYIIDQYTAWISENKQAIELYEKALGNYDYSSVISGTFEKVQYQKIKDELIAIGKEGGLSAQYLTANYKDLVDELDRAGVNVNALYAYIMRLTGLADRENIVQKLLGDMSSDGLIPPNLYHQEEEKLRAFINGLSEEEIKIISGLDIDWTTFNADEIIDRMQQEIDNSDKLKVGVEVDVPKELSFTQSINDLNNLETALNNVGNAMANIDENGKFQLGDLDSIADYFLGLEQAEQKVEYETEAVANALRMLGEGSGSIEQQADAINTLADNYLHTSGILTGLTEANKALYIIRLQEMGILNAEEIVTATLNAQLSEEAQQRAIVAAQAVAEAQAKELVASETVDLTNLTAEEINALLEEGTITQETALKLLDLAIEKQAANGTVLTTSGDIANLTALCSSLGVAGSALERYAEMKRIAMDTSGKYTEEYQAGTLKRANQMLQNAIKSAYNSGGAQNNVPKVQYNGGSAVRNKLGYTPTSTADALSGSAAKAAQDAADAASKAAKDAADAAKDTFKELYDYFDRFIKVLDQRINLLKAHLEDVVGSFAKNTLISAEEDLIRSKMEGYSSAISMYASKASEALSKIPSDVASKLIDGSVAIDEFVGEGNEEVYEAIQDYDKWADKVAECKQQIVELREELRQLELTKFKNVAQDFQELFDVRKTQIDLISKAIDLFSTARDKIVGRAFYDESIEQTEKQLNSLLEKRTALTNQMSSAIANGIEVANEEWFEMLDLLESVNADILDAQKAIEDYKNAIIQLYVDAFDREAKRYSNQIALRQKAIDALERQISVVASAGNVAGREYYDRQIEQTGKQIVMLEEERRELERRLSAAIDNGVREGTDEWYSMVDAINEVDAAIQTATQSIEEYKNSIVQLYMELFDREAARYAKQTDLRQKAIDALSKQISLVEATGNVAGAAYFEEQLRQTREQIVTLEDERRALEKKMQEGIANGVKVGTDEWLEMVSAINEVDSAIQDAKISVEEYTDAIAQSYVELFTRESDRYAKQLSLRQKAVTALENQMKAIEAAGNVVGESFIQEQIEQTQKQMAMLEKERDALVKKMSTATANGVSVGTEEWYSMVDALNEVDSEIQSCIESIEAMDDAILALHTETFERIQQRFSNLSSEMSNMADMFEDFDVATVDNTWTKEGLAQMGLYAQQYELAKKQVSQYNAEIEELNKQYAAGKYSVTQYTTKLAELKDAQWNAIKASQSAKDSIISLNKARVDIVVEGINKEIDAFKELTDAQREQLSAEKDLHDYEKSIAESAKSITDLERQLAAISEDDSLSARAKKLKLEEELQEAREELAEKEYDHSIEMQQEALAQQAEDYEEARELEIEALQATLEEEQTLLAESFNAVKENAALIGEELILMAQNLNITMSPEITAPWQAGVEAIAAYSELLTTESSAFIETLAAVEASEWNLQTQANNTSQAISDVFGNRADELIAQTDTANQTFRDEEQAAIDASAAIAENFAKQSGELVAQTTAANQTFREEEEAALRASAAIAENFSKRADELVATTDAANAAFRAEEEAAEDASRSIADAFGNRADELVATIENARNSTENLSRMSDALADSLSNSIDGSYSGGSAVSALDSISDAANGVADAARDAARALQELGMARQNSNSGPHVTTVYGGPNGTSRQVNWTGYGTNVESYSFDRRYATGTKRVSHDELAWTQEQGTEMIISPTDGAVLTPLKTGDAVLPADQTANIWEWSKFDPTEFARKLIQSTPNTGGTVQANTMQVGSLVTVNGNINDSMEMMKIASTTASNKIKQSFYELSNGLNR